MTSNSHVLPVIDNLSSWQLKVSAKSTWMFLQLHFNTGVSGWGEMTCYGTELQMAALCHSLKKSLNYEPAISLNDVLRRIQQVEMDNIRHSLCSALEQAYFTSVAGDAGLPMTSILGGPLRRDIPFYANINRGISDRSAQGFATAARHIVETTGAQAIKIAPFDGYRWQLWSVRQGRVLIDAGLARIAAVREAIPSHITLLVDCHGRFNPSAARDLFSELTALNVYWIEEPCVMEQLSAREQRAMRSAANDQGMLLAGAETLVSLGQMSRLLAAEGHDVVLPDLRLTGINNGIAMLHLASAKNVYSSLHNPAGPVLDAISVQVAASVPGFLILERQVGESPLFEQLRDVPFQIHDGALKLDSHKGLGFEMQQALLSPLNIENTDLMSFNGMSGAGPDA